VALEAGGSSPLIHPKLSFDRSDAILKCARSSGDRVADFESEGRGFKSYRAHHNFSAPQLLRGVLLLEDAAELGVVLSVLAGGVRSGPGRVL